MVLTRAQNQPGPDGILGDDPATAADESADDIQDATNTDSPWVDQSQTYTSHPAHQAYLREYTVVAGKPVDTGKLLGGTGNGATGMATWASLKAQAETKLGLHLVDKDVLNIPMIATDPYGNFIPGTARGLPQYVLKDGTMLEGNTASPVPAPANVRHFDTPFLTDIAHNADPSPQDTDHNPATPPVDPTPDPDTTIQTDFTQQAPGTYDDELLDTHFTAGDGRVNENIALTTIHQIFHSEHDRLVDDINHTLTTDTSPEGVAALAQWQRDRRPEPLELRPAPVPGGSLRHGDGVPAPRVRGVRAEDPAGHPALPRLQPGRQPGHPGRVRARRLPLRPLDARRHRRA